MNNTEVIQVRITPQIKTLSQKQARRLGFLSVQEAVRIFLVSFAHGQVIPTLTTTNSETIVLTNAAKERYKKINADINGGINLKQFTSPQEAVKWLNK